MYVQYYFLLSPSLDITYSIRVCLHVKIYKTIITHLDVSGTKLICFYFFLYSCKYVYAWLHVPVSEDKKCCTPCVKMFHGSHGAMCHPLPPPPPIINEYSLTITLLIRFSIAMPTAINVLADYDIWKQF